MHANPDTLAGLTVDGNFAAEHHPSLSHAKHA
jgi:hypothetical protein